MDKPQLRNFYRKQRDVFKTQSDAFLRASEQLALRVRQFLNDVPKGSLIFGYKAFQSEAPLPWVEGYRWAFPRIKSKEEGGEMDFHESNQDDTSFKRSSYGILEPSVGEHVFVHPEEAKLIFVPALAFDQEGYRLGYGKGFYDRFLAPLGGALKVGVGFQMQVYDGLLPKDRWDLPLDWLVTEQSIIGFSRRK